MIKGYQRENYQDTVSTRIINYQDTLKSGKDTLSTSPDTGSISSGNNQHDTVRFNISRQPALTSPEKISAPVSTTQIIANDTSTVCKRNPVADVTFYNPDFVLREADPVFLSRFPYQFTGNNIRIRKERKESIEKHLKDGIVLPRMPFHQDWVIGILLLSIMLFTVVQGVSKNFLTGTTRFFLFRGTTEEGSRDLIGMFQWQSTLLNLSSFMIISVYACFTALYYDVIPQGFQNFVVWSIILGFIIVSVTLRHIVCIITGIMSDQRSLFHDYLHTVYQSYRFGAIFLFILVIMMSYTELLADKSYFIIGPAVLLMLYLIRIFRLFLIFINRNISIFYLILYLCALEFLPVLITIKYFSGLA
ncbi:MAG: DUF4271 domain-containing protein [Bacteroidia bacterium]|nr:DUF4271 domain-containing protein [Bacteroidia bacterium]